MPELPEVETTARFLKAKIAGAVITEVVVNFKGLVSFPSPRVFKSTLAGARVLNVGRRAKFLVFTLQKPGGGQTHLFSHLRMSGSYSVREGKEERGKHDHIIFVLDDGREVRYCDVRKFGRFNLTEMYEQFTAGLGPEPLSSSFTSEDFIERIKKYKGSIKPLLLNQSVIAGIGNIYADEALWRAGIHPLCRAALLSKRKLTLLHDSIVTILSQAIDSRGTDFGDGVVYNGGYAPRVYGRAGKKCFKCNHEIRRIVVAQRGTHICLKCQRQPAWCRDKERTNVF